jgi:uncharacterized alpha/beta hydrolase family protein
MKKTVYAILILIAFATVGCDRQNPSDDTPNKSHGSRVTNILFAHGFLADSSVWDGYVRFTEHYQDKVWTTYRTSVSKTGSIAKRAEQLANYINAQKFSDDSVVAVGHSMGGLDLRYIIGKGNEDQSDSNKFYRAAKTVHKIYTIATPHKGIDETTLDMLGSGGALDDLKPYNMEKFNQRYPCSTLKIDGRNIPMLAMRFHCNENNSDGAVTVQSQSLDGAPYTRKVFGGRHSDAAAIECPNATQELEQADIIRGILENREYEISTQPPK